MMYFLELGLCISRNAAQLDKNSSLISFLFIHAIIILGEKTLHFLSHRYLAYENIKIVSKFSSSSSRKKRSTPPLGFS